MNKAQLTTILAPLVGFISAWLARKIPFIDAATWAGWIDAGITALVVAFMGWMTNKAGVASAAASYKDTIVVTDPATAKAVPSPDVVSVTEVKVVPK